MQLHNLQFFFEKFQDICKNFRTNINFRIFQDKSYNFRNFRTTPRPVFATFLSSPVRQSCTYCYTLAYKFPWTTVPTAHRVTKAESAPTTRRPTDGDSPSTLVSLCQHSGLLKGRGLLCYFDRDHEAVDVTIITICKCCGFTLSATLH